MWKLDFCVVIITFSFKFNSFSSFILLIGLLMRKMLVFSGKKVYYLLQLIKIGPFQNKALLT